MLRIRWVGLGHKQARVWPLRNFCYRPRPPHFAAATISSAIRGRADSLISFKKPPFLPSTPEKFHLEPLTDPDLMLSHHPARAIDRRLPPSVEFWAPPVASWPRSTLMTCSLRVAHGHGHDLFRHLTELAALAVASDRIPPGNLLLAAVQQSGLQRQSLGRNPRQEVQHG